ncbi:DUF692 domain-containing protein [Gayadomonas joobiniege]|uniref:HvfB family MNIO-type RiPP peptide maturase n=1 Tax=Gayadomonas joobiniege TaxID=1234606 RepID=UPI000360BF4D|nr:DUF692 domain-containing protein [Gayadomonas joobiniege]
MFKQVRGAGLGLRREFINSLLNTEQAPYQFLEVAPENWIKYTGSAKPLFEQLAERYAISCHGLSLSIGSPDPLDIDFVKTVKQFLDRYQIEVYSEHLSYCSSDGHLYDLMPMPFTDEAVEHTVARIKRVQDILERPLVLENISFYTYLDDSLSELDFIKGVLANSGAKLLLDVNNVYVNSVNHGYDPFEFIRQLPSKHIVYGHVAGHYNEAEDLIIDTHASAVIDEVWHLLAHAYQVHGVFPTVLERDFNMPSLMTLFSEVDKIKQIQQQAG